MRISRWDRYLGMTAAMTQVPVPTATRIENFEKRASYICEHFLTASTSPSIFDKYQNCVKLIINKRIRGMSKAHDVFRVFEVKGEKQVNFKRNTKFQINNIDKTNKIVELTEI